MFIENNISPFLSNAYNLKKKYKPRRLELTNTVLHECFEKEGTKKNKTLGFWKK